MSAKRGPPLQGSEVSVAGFALGATAALSVAGAKLDVARYMNSCGTTNLEAQGPDCGWYAAQGVKPSDTSREALAEMVRDPG